MLLKITKRNSFGLRIIKNFLNNLEELRKIAGLTQQELSESAEVSRKSINAIENGIYVPSTVLALKISKTLGCEGGGFI